MSDPAFEKLGSFYLGKSYDLGTRTRSPNLVLYDSKDLVTHAVCVGMTGSGKTGLCVGLLEEAAIDGIPAIIIDPKGDLSNLLLNFPALRSQDFRPWINEDDARKKGLTPDEFAAKQAELWTKGLADWGQDPSRVQKLKDAAEFVVYTPGSHAGVPVSIMKSFAAPPFEIIDDRELFRERISTTSTSLLSLMGIAADPVQSREHILLSAIFNDAWTKGQDLDLPALIARVQAPPFTKLGVMELESVYSAKDRFSLAMAMNNLVAAPGFSAWTEGQPLDIQNILYTPSGKPRHAIFSIAHLPDAERMFFVSLLLNQVLAWTRSQSGTTSLRAILYMDEIAGYFPPTANPPSKQPLLTLMKQARAFGVGVVLVTQNPVDLDYKGLSNAGTWFIGRLQTERDKLRVLDGLEGAAAQASSKFDRASVDRALSALGSRVFLMNNVHEDAPEIFETRWCMSYLRGPLTRGQIKQLMDPYKAGGATATTTAPAAPTGAIASNPAPGPASSSAPPATSTPAASRPILPPEIPTYFLPARTSGGITYHPMLLGTAKVYFSDAKSATDVEQPIAQLLEIQPGPVPVDWDNAQDTDVSDADVETDGEPGAAFLPLSPEASKPKNYDAWKKSFADGLFRNEKLELFRCTSLKQVSQGKETEQEFRVRLTQLAREQRDATAEKLRQKYAPKMAALQDRLRRAQQAAEVQREQASGATWSAALSAGAAILGAFMGRKVASAGNIGI
ncbi:MAG: hypothetical protein K2X32_11430, partial [Phycisphaerales bacterium]|nr:hypothetical protein [Phycisphaerales bacterium]